MVYYQGAGSLIKKEAQELVKKIDKGVKRGVAKALKEHKKMGSIIPIMKYGKIVFIPPEDILDGNHRPRGEILYFGEELVVEIYEDDAAAIATCPREWLVQEPCGLGRVQVGGNVDVEPHNACGACEARE